MYKIGVLGSGMVAKTLGAGFIKHGYSVKLGTRDAEKLHDWVSTTPGSSVGTFSEAAAFGDIIVLAVAGQAATDAIEMAGVQNFDGKTVIDTTNPIGSEPPVDGVLRFFTAANESLMEILQARFPAVNFVKAFNSVGNAAMVDPVFESGKPSMFICGNSDKAKEQVRTILEKFGWEVEDMGKATAAGAIEALCILWCIPGFRKNSWSHAFKLLR